MPTAEMARQIAAISPRFKARIAGVCEALEGFTSTFGQVTVIGKVFVSGSATATAANILAHERLFWLGFASALVGVAFHIAWTLLFYELFKPVNKTISLLAAFVGLVGCAVLAVACLLYIAPLALLDHPAYFAAFTPDQVRALAFLLLRLNGQCFNIFLVLFGLRMFFTGYLIFRSTFMPRIIGVLVAIDGVGWMFYLHPSFAISMFLYIAIAAGLAEIPLQLWLIIMGVNSQRWNEQARAARLAPL